MTDVVKELEAIRRNLWDRELKVRSKGLDALIARLRDEEVLAEIDAWVDVPSAEAGGLGLEDLWLVVPPNITLDFLPVHVTITRRVPE